MRFRENMLMVMIAVGTVAAAAWFYRLEHAAEPTAENRTTKVTDSVPAGIFTQEQLLEPSSPVRAHHPSTTPVTGRSTSQPESSPGHSSTSAPQAIDWASLGPMAPIPREMPNRESDDPEEAGFSSLWAEHSLGDIEAGTPVVRGVSNDRRVALGPLVSDIASQRKRPEDDWAHDMERQLREVIDREFAPEPNAVHRVFCNSVGCLAYFEGFRQNALGTVLRTLRTEPFKSQFQIDPARIFFANAKVTSSQLNDWDLIIYVRDPALPLENGSGN